MSDDTRSAAGRVLLVLGRLALAVVFLVAAYAKLKPQAAMLWSISSVKISLSLFALQVDSYQLLPPGGVNAVAHLLPFLELGLGLWLLSGWGMRASSLLSALLLSGFFALMVRTFAMGLEINCACFGPGEKLGPKTLLRDGALLVLTLAVTIGAFVSRRKKVSAPVPTATPERAD